MLEEKEPAKPTSDIVLDPKSLLANGKGDQKLVQEKPKLGVTISNVTASWEADSTINTFRNITLTAAPGEFIGVAGPVGSGKVNYRLQSGILLYYRINIAYN